MAHFLPLEHVRQVNKLEWPNQGIKHVLKFIFVLIKKNIEEMLIIKYTNK